MSKPPSFNFAHYLIEALLYAALSIAILTILAGGIALIGLLAERFQ